MSLGTTYEGLPTFNIDDRNYINWHNKIRNNLVSDFKYYYLAYYLTSMNINLNKNNIKIIKTKNIIFYTILLLFMFGFIKGFIQLERMYVLNKINKVEIIEGNYKNIYTKNNSITYNKKTIKIK